jgi:hypothetical protein
MRYAYRFETKRLTFILFLAALVGCNTKRPSPLSDSDGHVRAGGPENYQTKPAVEGEQAPTWTNFPEDKIPPDSNQFMRCQAYTVISYDANWHNDEGNVGLFVLRSRTYGSPHFVARNREPAGHSLKPSVKQFGWTMKSLICCTFARSAKPSGTILFW